MKKLILCLIASFFALSMWATQYCETVITSTAGDAQLLYSCYQVDATHYAVKFEGVDAEHAMTDIHGVNFGVNDINGHAGANALNFEYDSETKSAIATFEKSSTPGNPFVAVIYSFISGYVGERQFNCPTDITWGSCAPATKDYFLTAYITDGTTGPVYAYCYKEGSSWKNAEFPGVAMSADAHVGTKTYVYNVENAPAGGINVIFNDNGSDSKQADAISALYDKNSYNVYYHEGKFRSSGIDLHNYGDVTVYVYTTDAAAPKIYWSRGHNNTNNPAPTWETKPDMQSMPNCPGWYSKTFTDADLTYGVDYVIYYPSNSTQSADFNTTTKTVVNASTHPGESYSDITIKVQASEQPNIHYWGAGSRVTPTEFASAPAMTGVSGASGWYEYTITNVDDACGLNYIVKMESKQTANLHTFESVCKSADASGAKVVLTDAECPSVEPVETTWDPEDEDAAKGVPVFISRRWGGDKAKVVDDIINGDNVQLNVTGEQPTEWLVIDLGSNFDISKFSLTTTGNRKDRNFNICTAPEQVSAPIFADGTDALAGRWTVQHNFEDDYANTGLTTLTYSVNWTNVRYIKYEATERNVDDQYGVAICEFRVKGVTDDPDLNTPHHIEILSVPEVYTGQTGDITIAVCNHSNRVLSIDPAQLSASSSADAIATASREGDRIRVRGVSAGDATITINYGSLHVDQVVTIQTMTAPDAPTHDAEDVLSLWSNTYSNAAGYGWYDWGGCTYSSMSIDGNDIERAKAFHFGGSQFNSVDVSEYDYFHIDLYPTAATTIGIIPITTKEAGGNNAERGVTTATLTANQWNYINIPLSDFTTNGVIDLNRLYQMKYVQQINPVGGQTNADGSFDLFFDNVYFWKESGDLKTVSAVVAPASSGSVAITATVGGTLVTRVAAGTSVTFTATPAAHYHFVKWNDENTTNPRVITINENTNLTATFARNVSTPEISSLTQFSVKDNSVVYSIEVTDSEYEITRINVTDAAKGFDNDYTIADGKIIITGLTPATAYNFVFKAVNTEGTESAEVNNAVTTLSIYPPKSPALPVRNDADIRSIYTDVYHPALESFHYGTRSWVGDGVSEEERTVDGDSHRYYTCVSAHNTVWGGAGDGDAFMALTKYRDGANHGIDVRSMKFLHIDVWSLREDDHVGFKINGENLAVDQHHPGNGWYGFDLPLYEVDGTTPKVSVLNNVRYIEFYNLTHAPYFAIDNLYFYRPSTASIPVAAIADPAIGGTALPMIEGEEYYLVDNDGSMTFVATPNIGYRFVSWTNTSDEIVSTTATYTKNNIITATTLTAHFQKTYDVSATSANPTMGSAKVNELDATTVDAGDVVTFTATPTNSNYTFVSWTNALGVEVSTSETYVIDNVDADYSLTANFDYARTVYCQTPVYNDANDRFIYMSCGATGNANEYEIRFDGTETEVLTGLNDANFTGRDGAGVVGPGGNNILAKAHWTIDNTGYGSIYIHFTAADWRLVDFNNHYLPMSVEGKFEFMMDHNFPVGTTIDWRNTCADTEAPELEEPKYDVLSETSVRLSLKATDDRDFIRYTIRGFDGGDIVVDASAGVRIYKEVSGMEPNYPYRVTVVAADKAGNTDTKIITVTATPDPTAPFNVKANAMALSMTDILITASADEDRTSDITYNIYNEDGTQLLATCYAAPGATATHKFSGLTPETTYTYKVAALNFAGVEATPRITVSATTYNEDLALNQPAYAGYADPNGQVSGSNNGNYSQRWGSGHDNTMDYTDDWWYVDLGSVCSIDNIRILWETARPQMYAIYVSDDAAAWTPVYTTTEAPTSYTNLENHPELFTEYYQFSNRAKGRYVKVAATGNVAGKPEGNANLQYGISMWAFEVYGRSAKSGGANITSAVRAGVTTNSATLNVTLASYSPANDYIIVMDPTNGINQRCKIVDVVVKEYANATDKVGSDVPKKQITVTGLNVNTTYNFQLIAVDVEGKESVVYPNTGYVTIKTLNAAPEIGQAPLPPFRNGRDFRSIYSDFYKSALKNPDGFSHAKWINVYNEELEVDEDHHILYGYNGNNRESVWGDTEGPESFQARDGSDGDPVFPHLNYTDGANTGLDVHEFTKLHIDLWLQGTTETKLIVRVNDTELTTLTGDDAVRYVESGNGRWYSYDIAITPERVAALGANLTNLRWMKFQFPAGFNGDYWALDNVYFYKDVDYTGYHEVRVKANLKDAGKPYIVGVDYEDVYFAQPEENLTLRAHSAEDRGFFFVNWTDDDDNDDVVSEDDPTVDVIVSNPIHYTANYIRKYKVVGIAKEIDSQKTGDVTVVLSDAHPSEVGGFNFVTPGTNATFTATQISPYEFKYWALDGKFYDKGVGANHQVIISDIQRDIELRAIYDKGGEAYKSTEIPTGFPEMTSTDGHLRVSYIWLGGKRYRILIEGTPECCITAAYNNFNFYVHNINGGRGGEDGRSFPASVWNDNFFPYGYGYTYVDFEADDANLIKIDADRNYVVFYRTPIAEGASHSGRDLVECKLPAMGIDWRNQYDFHFPLAAKEATPGAGITWGSAAWFNTEDTPGVPNDNTDVFLLSPTTVNVNDARAKSVTICTDFSGYLTGHAQAGMPEETPHTGHLTINSDAALQVQGKVTHVKGANFYVPESTTPADLYLASGAAAGNYKHATLIHGDTEGNTGATVEFHSASSGAPNDCKWQWMAVPFDAKVALPEYYSAWIRSYHDGAWHEDVTNETVMQAFQGYELTQRTEHLGYPYILTGNLASTANHTLTLHNGLNLIGNSWSAPINISGFDVADFNTIGAEASIVMINTGLDDGGVNAVHVQYADASSDVRTPGEYVAVPICVAQYLNDAVKVIPPMQSFQIYSPYGGSLTLNYNELVRTSGAVNVQANRAPQRSVAEPDTLTNRLRIYVEGETDGDYIYLFQNEEATDGFDNGWDARKMDLQNPAASALASSSASTLWQISTKPMLNGTMLMFKPGVDDTYRVGFDYTGEETLWLYDMMTQEYTAINNETTYLFAPIGTFWMPRFLITDYNPNAQMPGVTTDIVNIEECMNGLVISNTAHQQMTVRVFDMSGRLFSEMQTSAPMYEVALPTDGVVYTNQVSVGNDMMVRKVVS